MPREALKMTEHMIFNVETDKQSKLLLATWDDPSVTFRIKANGKDLSELKASVLEAVRFHFRGQTTPRSILLYLTEQHKHVPVKIGGPPNA